MCHQSSKYVRASKTFLRSRPHEQTDCKHHDLHPHRTAVHANNGAECCQKSLRSVPRRQCLPTANGGSERGRQPHSHSCQGVSNASGTKACASSCIPALAGRKSGSRSRTPLVTIHCL